MLAEKLYPYMDESKFKKNLILANYLVDSAAVNDIIDTFFNKSKVITEQTYLTNIYEWNNESLEEFIRFKIGTYLM